MSAFRYTRYSPVSLSQIRPAGWIMELLKRQCSSITGHPQASGYPFDHTFWGNPTQLPDVPDPNMLWWPYEQTAYRIDGAIKVGFLTGDDTVYRMALAEIDQAIEQAAPDDFIGPEMFRTHDRWPYAVFFRAVLAQYAISSDKRYLDALVRHYHSTPHPMNFGRDVTGVEILLALYAETGQADLLETAQDLYARFNRQAGEFDLDYSLAGMRSDKPVTTHGVSFNEIAKLGAILYAATGDQDSLAATLNAYAKVERDHVLADGLHSSAEGMCGHDPLASHETCNITDYTWSLGHLVQITGDAHFADQIERVIFNALPGVIIKDFKALQYFSCPNQLVATNVSNHNAMSRGDNRMSYRPGHPVQCCTGNAQRALPNFVERMWMRGQGDRDDEIVAALFGPGQLDTQVAGTQLTIQENTRYPFEQNVSFSLHPEHPVRFTFTVRVPGWCHQPAITLNDQPLTERPTPGSFYRIEREWQPGDQVVLTLPFELALKRWPEGGISLEFGPLTLSLPVAAPLEIEIEDAWVQTPEEFRLSGPQQRLPGFPAYRLTPASQWAYALAVDEQSLAQVAKVTWNDPSGFPLDLDNPALRVSVPARRVKDWTLVETDRVIRSIPSFEDGKFCMVDRPVEGHFTLTPPLPDLESLPERLSDEVEWIDLVPYGNTLLRMTVFPDGMKK
ncbi:MAG: glycoside hydrolase family 127 protein [Anaerolineae bacterium]|nr:glycoside hydrolase family 127 protein [Anaerolineae bacterium]